MRGPDSDQELAKIELLMSEFTSVEEREELEKAIRALTSDANADKEAVEITEEASDVDAEVAEVKQTKASKASKGTKAQANVETILDGRPTLPDQESRVKSLVEAGLESGLLEKKGSYLRYKEQKEKGMPGNLCWGRWWLIIDLQVQHWGSNYAWYLDLMLQFDTLIHFRLLHSKNWLRCPDSIETLWGKKKMIQYFEENEKAHLCTRILCLKAIDWCCCERNYCSY